MLNKKIILLISLLLVTGSSYFIFHRKKNNNDEVNIEDNSDNSINDNVNEDNQEELINENAESSGSLLLVIIIIIVVIAIIIAFFIYILFFRKKIENQEIIENKEIETYPLPELKLQEGEEEEKYADYIKERQKIKNVKIISKEKIEVLTDKIIEVIKTGFNKYIQETKDNTNYSEDEYLIDFSFDANKKNNQIDLKNDKGQIIRRVNLIEHKEIINHIFAHFFEPLSDIPDFQKDGYLYQDPTYLFLYTVIEPFFACIKEKGKGKILFISELAIITSSKIDTVEITRAIIALFPGLYEKIKAFLARSLGNDMFLITRTMHLFIKKNFSNQEEPKQQIV